MLEDWEDEHDPEFVKMIQKARADYARDGGVPLEQVLAELDL